MDQEMKYYCLKRTYDVEKNNKYTRIQSFIMPFKDNLTDAPFKRKT